MCCQQMLRSRSRAAYQTMVPTGTGKQGKPGKWEGIFKSGNFVKTGKLREKSGNFTQNTGKIGKIIILEN